MPKENHHSFYEPDCEHNAMPGKKGCLRSLTGDSSAGGCAFEGALTTLLSIRDAVHLVHGPLSCLDSFTLAGSGVVEKSFAVHGEFGTALTKADLLEGGEEKLKRAIAFLCERKRPPVLFVYDTCAAMLAMEDLDTVCREAEQEWNVPIIPIHSAGSKGSRNMGSRLAGEALTQRIIGQGESAETLRAGAFPVNLIRKEGGEAEGRAVEELLSKLGVRVHARVGLESSYASLAAAHLAKVNILVGSRAMLTLARRMKEEYDIPYLEGSFYGTREIRFSLRQLAFHFQNRELDQRITRFMRKKERSLQKKLTDTLKLLKGKRVVLYLEGVDNSAFVSMFQELGLRVVAVGTDDGSQEELSRIRERVGADTELIPNHQDAAILKAFRVRRAELLIVSGRHAFLPMKEKLPFLEIDKEHFASYIGYEGVARLGEDLLRQLNLPIWRLLTEQAPWKENADDSL